MTLSLRTLFLIFALLVTSVQAAAQTLRRTPEIDPAMAYVLVEIRNQDGGRQPGTLVLARYDSAGNDVRGGTRSPGSSLGRDVPVRVTIASRPLIKTDQSRLYLVALAPDIWVIEGAGGTAFSLGSRTFTVAAGDILDLGVLSPRTDWLEGEGPPNMGQILASTMLFGAFARRPDARPAMLEMRPRGPEDFAVPEPLRAAIRPAQLQAGARFGNYLGGLVNRIDGREGRAGGEPSQAATTPAEPSQQP